MVVADDNSMTNLHMADNRSWWSIGGGLHALVSLRKVCKQLIARDSDFRYRKLHDF